MTKSNSIAILKLAFMLLLAGQSVCFAAPVAPVQNAEAADEAVAQTDTVNLAKRGSLMRVPQSAGYYFATMNHQAVIEAVTKSNAMKSIKASDVARGMKKAYRRGRTRGYEDYNEDNPFAQYLKGYGETIDNVIFQSVWQVAKQVIENELFIYADNDAVELSLAINRAQSEMIQKLGVNGLDDMDDGPDAQQAAIMADLLRNHFADMECPTVILGSRLDNPDGFRGMLELARSAAEQGMRNLPEDAEFVKQWWKVVEEDNQFLLTADIDLSKLPWEEFMDEVDDPELRNAIQTTVGNKRATVAMGVVDNLLIFGFARNQEQLTSFGEGPRLVNMPELKKLREAVDANQTITSVAYMSEKVAKASYSLDQIYETQKFWIGMMINVIDEVPDEEKEALTARIETEFEEFLADVNAFRPEYGMLYGFTTLDTEGFCGYLLQNTKPLTIDGSQSLDLAKHAGSNTLGFFAQRPRKTIEQYEFAAKWSSRLYGYAKQYGLPLVEEEMWEAIEDATEEAAEQLEKVAPSTRRSRADVDQTDEALNDFNRELGGDAAEDSDSAEDNEAELAEDEASDERDDLEKLKSLLADFEAFATEFDKITRETYLPSVRDTETALFVDMISGPEPWHPDMPKSERPLPIPLPALIVGTRDAEQTIKASEDYWRAFETFVNKIKTYADEDELEDFNLIPPERLVDDDGTSFRWSLLSDFGDFDPSLRLGGLISEDWLVINTHPQQAQALVGTRDADLFGPAATTDPSYSLMFYDHRVMMDSLQRWFDFAETEARKEGDDFFDLSRFDSERNTLQFTEPQLRDWLGRIWAMGECWKGLSLRTYAEGDTTVTEYLLKFEDVVESP